MHTLLNSNQTNTFEQPIFLGQDMGIQRYDKFKYKEIGGIKGGVGFFDGMCAFFWRPTDVNLTQDRTDYAHMDETKKFIFTSNLKYQTLLDTMQSRGIPFLSKYTSLPEVEAAFSSWQFFETLHSFAYTYIIQNVYANPAEIFDHVLDNEDIMCRARSVVNSYDLLLKETDPEDIKTKLYLNLINVNILEGLKFYVSFACAFAFAENKEMEGNAKIIALIKRDEQMHLSLTQNIINILRKEESEGFIETVEKNSELARALYADVIDQEKAWIDYLFHKGTMLGLSADVLKEYMVWLANKRAAAIGIKNLVPNCRKENPIGWIEKREDSSTIQVAPQETEIQSYVISAIHDDTDQDFFKEL